MFSNAKLIFIQHFVIIKKIDYIIMYILFSQIFLFLQLFNTTYSVFIGMVAYNIIIPYMYSCNIYKNMDHTITLQSRQLFLKVILKIVRPFRYF